jgi:hypothetical protein
MKSICNPIYVTLGYFGHQMNEGLSKFRKIPLSLQILSEHVKNKQLILKTRLLVDLNVKETDLEKWFFQLQVFLERRHGVVQSIPSPTAR